MVKGDLSVSSGRLDLGGTVQAEIHGDLYTEGQGCIRMDTYLSEGTMTVHGDVVIDSARQTELMKGSLVLLGDLVQTEQAAANSLRTDGSFQLLLKGDSLQKIEAAHAEGITLGTLDLRGSTAVEVPDEIHGKAVHGMDRIKGKKRLDLYLSYYIPEQDESIRCETVSFHGDTIVLSDYDLTCSGNLEISGVKYFMANGSKITAGGNLSCATQQYFYQSNGELTVKGDLNVSSGRLDLGGTVQAEIHGDLYTEGQGCIRMDTYLSEGTMTVHGDVVIDSARQTELTKGRLVLLGDLVQKENEETDNLVIGDEFFLELCGKQIQIIDLQGVDEVPYLNLSQSKAVRLMQDFSGENLRGVEKIVFDEDTLYLDYRWIYASSNGTVNGNLKCFGVLNVDRYSLSIAGNYTQYYETWIHNDGTLSVAGDFIVDQGLATIEKGLIQVKGDTRIKKDGGVNMRGRESCRFLAEGDYFSACRNLDYSSWYTGGTLELRGNLIKKDVASSFGLCLDKTKVVFSGDKIQTVKVPDNILFGEVACIDMQSSTGVDFCGASLKADQIIGFSKIQSGGMLNLYKSRVTLTQDEEFSGIITMSDTYLDCNGHEFRISGGGNLEQTDGLVNLDHGTLYVDGDYILHCNSILQMIQWDDLLQVKGNFDTQSFMNHSSMLWNGRMELWGDFNQGGDKTAFASSENFVIAFMGSGQTAHFDDVGYSRFANIDPDHSSVSMKDEPLVFVANVGLSIGKGVVSGLQEALGDLELTVTAEAIASAVGIGASVLGNPTVASVMIALNLIAGVIGTIESLFMIAQAAGGIYSTATGTGTVYDKLEAFAHDFIILVAGIATLTLSVKVIDASLSAYTDRARDLFGRESRLTPSEVTKTYKGAKLINSFDEFAEYAKEFLDDDALKYAKEVLGNNADDTAQLKKIGQLVEDGSKKIGKKLSKEELKAGLDALWNDGGPEIAVRAIECWSKGGLSAERIEYYLSLARKYPDSDTVVLGSVGKYDVIAENNQYSYFKMHENIWGMLENETGKNYDIMWKVNEKFIDEQIAAGKRILLSNNPKKEYYFSGGARRFYQRELDYLTDQGYEFEKISDELWQAIKK